MLGPAAREPGDPVRAEAIELLACLASQQEPPLFGAHAGIFSANGHWSIRARVMAFDARPDSDGSWDDWRERYAEAEARLRDEVRRG